MNKYKKGEKFYIEVEVDVAADKDSIWVVVPDHPKNEYDGLCVYTKNLISKKDIEKEKKAAYHKGHEDGYKMGFSALMF